MAFYVFLQIAGRNIRRNKRRSLLTVAAIAIGLASLLYFGAINDGFNEQMVKSSVSLMMGHIQIHKKGYHDEYGVEKYISAPQKYIEAIKDIPHLKHLAPRVKIQGLVSSPENSYGVHVLGILPEAEAKVSTIKKGIVAGNFFEDNDHSSKSILLGKNLAKSLKVEVGNKVVLMTQAYDGSLGAMAYTVKGIFRTGSPDMDKGIAYIPIESAKGLLSYEDKISEIVVVADREEFVEPVKNMIKERLGALSAKSGEPLEILSWKELAPEIVQLINMNDVSMYIVLGILFMVVMLGIINTLLMSIFERMRELGIMMAIGTSPGYVVVMIIFEAILLGVIGIIIGSILGVSVVVYYGQRGIDFSAYSEGLAMFLAMETTLYPVLRINTYLIYVITVFLTTALASIYPALKAARLKPVDAIHHL